MIAYSSLVGLPVINIEDNSKIALVRDILYSGTDKILIGLLVEKKSLLSPAKYIPLKDIQKIQKTMIKVKGYNCIKEISGQDNILQILDDSKNCRISTKVYTAKEEKVGEISDIMFDFETGTIESYIVSDGFLEDIFSGRRLFLNEETLSVKNKLYIINSSQKRIKKPNNHKQQERSE